MGSRCQRQAEMKKQAQFDEEVIRKYFTLIDLEEFRIRELLTSDTELRSS
jgi:hypothetical protein